jgi:hypothetical protein
MGVLMNGPRYGKNRNHVYGIELKGKTGWHPVPNSQCMTMDNVRMLMGKLSNPPNNLDKYRIATYGGLDTNHVG